MTAFRALRDMFIEVRGLRRVAASRLEITNVFGYRPSNEP
jgi:hypothetical protein